MEKIRKFCFDNSINKLELSHEEKMWFLTTVDKLKIELIEIETYDPNEIILIIEKHNIRIPLYLYKYRSKMIFQNGKYILDTQSIEDFKIDINISEFQISLHSENNSEFKLTIYYSIQHKNS